jgi:hypothetical protein
MAREGCGSVKGNAHADFGRLSQLHEAQRLTIVDCLHVPRAARALCLNARIMRVKLLTTIPMVSPSFSPTAL